MSGYEEEEEDRAESPGFSCVSLKSDRSMYKPPLTSVMNLDPHTQSKRPATNM